MPSRICPPSVSNRFHWLLPLLAISWTGGSAGAAPEVPSPPPAPLASTLLAPEYLSPDFSAPPAPVAAAEEEASEPPVTGGMEVDYVSRYMWRGQRWSRGPVLQPSGWISARDFTFSVWSNFVLGEELQQGKFNEVDFYLSYAGHWGKLTIEPTFQHYVYPGQNHSPPTGEVALKLAYPLVGGTAFFATQTWDVLEYGGSYFLETGLEWEREVDARTTAEAAFTLGIGSGRFNEVYIGPHVTALNAVVFEAAVTHYLTDKLYIKPHLGISTILDGHLRDQLRGPDTVYAGILVGSDL